MSELLPCPFCGGAVERDTRRAYRNISTGNFGDACAIYCTACAADMTFCYADYSGLDVDDVIAMCEETWNRRTPVPDPGREALVEALTKAAEQFEFYAQQHRAKMFNSGPSTDHFRRDILAKAETNDKFAVMCRAALAKASTPSTADVTDSTITWAKEQLGKTDPNAKRRPMAEFREEIDRTALSTNPDKAEEGGRG